MTPHFTCGTCGGDDVVLYLKVEISGNHMQDLLEDELDHCTALDALRGAYIYQDTKTCWCGTCFSDQPYKETGR